MTEVEQQVDWSSTQELVKEEVVYSVDYDESEEKEDFEKIPMIVVESSQQSVNSDAPIVIYPNDPSVVGAEEVVVEEQVGEIHWSGIVAEEEVVVQASSDAGEDTDKSRKDDFGDIPLNDQSYATYHPFPCDFCCRRFKKKANLINHMVAHQTQRPHSCGVCSSRFMRKCDLVNHQKIHAYVPNRDNRDDIVEDPSYLYATKKRVGRQRRRSSVASRQSLPRVKQENPSSPTSSPEGNYFKPTSYVDEDVKLLLEMTTKLHESRKSECGDTSMAAPNVVQNETRKTGTDAKPYVCNTCGRCFARESALVSHTQIHAEDYAYDCNKCGSRFFTMDLLKEHYSKKHDSVYSGDTTDDSDERNVDKGSSYTGDERFGTFYCHLCAISFHRLDLFKQHKRIHTRRDEYNGLYRCGICQTMFMTNDKLLEHLDSSVNCQRHVCLLCGEQFSDQPAVQSHIQSKHSRNMPPNTCTYCGKQCRDPKLLKRHFWVHVGDKRNSTTQENSKTVSCEECDEEFPDRRALMNHRHCHYTSNNQRRFVCNVCGKSFGSRSSQQIHNRIHTGERPYGCRYCWKAFADGGTLRKHERIHTGEKPYVCAVCPRAFNQRVVLREHIRSHHSGSVSKLGYSVPVFMCSVCGIVTSGSDELALHLVKHSDDNTIKNRTPSSGVRSYKRRKVVEANREQDYYRPSEFEEADYFETRNSDTDSVDSDRGKKPGPKRLTRNRRVNRYAKCNKTMDAAMKNITSIVEQPVRKAKMINTKLQSTAGRQKKGIKKRGRRSVEVSSVVTVLKPRVRTMSGRLSGRGDSLSEPLDESTTSPEKSVTETEDHGRKAIGRPRTKNVNYETLRALSKGLPPATFPEKKEGQSIAKEQDSIVKHEIDEEEDEEEETYACSVCNVSFPSKADLLAHVPLHI